MHEAFWNGLLDVRWEDAPLGPETTRLVLRLRECGYAERTCRDYGHAVIHLGRVLREETGGVEGVRDDAVIEDPYERLMSRASRGDSEHAALHGPSLTS